VLSCSQADGGRPRHRVRQWTVDWALPLRLPSYCTCTCGTLFEGGRLLPARPARLFACLPAALQKGNGWKYSGACAYDSLRATVHAAVALRTMLEPPT